MKKLSLITATSIIALMSFSVDLPNFDINEAEAKRGGFSSRSFSSRSFSRSSSWKSTTRRKSGSAGLWNRSSKGSKGSYKKAKPKTSSGYKKSTKVQSVKKTKFSTKSYTSKVAQRKVAAKSVETHRKQTSAFKKPAPKLSPTTIKSNPIASRASTRRVSYRTYYTRRDGYYRSRGWNRPVYVVNSYPRFGLWDATFMWYMMSSHPSWAYHHRSDPGYTQWRNEANRLAADNAELRGKLSRLDDKVSSMEGTPVNANYMPKGVDPNIALAADVVASQTGDLVINIGTGGKTGNYYAFCNYMASTTLKINCVNTRGSVDNLNGLVKGQFGAIMVQSDVINAWYRANPNSNIKSLQSDVYPEVVFMLVNKNTGVESIKDVDVDKHRIYFAGSGARKTVEGMAFADSSYKPLSTKGTEVSPNKESLQMLASNPNGIMFYVCGLKCGFIEQADKLFGSKLQLAAVDDWDFNDNKDQFGNRIYKFVEVPRIYKNLMPSKWVSNESVETLAVSAVFIVSNDWTAEKGNKGLTAMEAAVWPAMTKIQNKVGVPE